MPGANDRKREKEPAGDAPGAAPDPLGPLIDTLLASTALPRAELVRRVREALPSAVAEVAESNRALRESAGRREAALAGAVAELRSAADAIGSASFPPAAHHATRLRHLADALESVLQGQRDAAAGHVLSGATRERPLVLVADDDLDARETLLALLAPEYSVSVAADGEAAVELAQTEHPDAILMDLYMPRLDGLQALERLRGDAATADIPVIFVSARGDDAVKARTLDLGAADYLQKPFSDRELRARLERTLRLSQSQTALRELAQTDPLTGLANLRAFRARLDDEVKRARRYDTPLTAVMADMDHLKPVNDTLGHAAGDRAIAAVASVIRAELRETDFGARYGGDEFVLLLPHTTADEGRVLAERICARLKETSLEISGRRVPLGASFGVACLPASPDAAPEAFVLAADAALYRAKRAGRGRVEVSESLMDAEPREHG